MTKISLSVLALAAAASLCPAQQAAPAKSGTAVAAPAKTTKRTAAPAAAQKGPALPDGVPAGAKELQPFFWRYVDKKGVAWIYHLTPFGVVHQQETAEDRAERAATAAGVRHAETGPSDLTVVDKGGDTLEFARHTPFGNSIWTSKKTELSDEEAAVWAKAQATAASGQQAQH